MDELIKYFKTATLPTEPIQINQWITVSDSKTFIDTCQHRYDEGDEEGFVLLNAYKEAIDRQNKLKAPLEDQ